MKRIYINKTTHAIFFGKTMLLPGSNMVEEIDGKKFPGLGKLLEEEAIEETEDAVEAIKSANTQSVVEEIAQTASKDDRVKAAAAKRKKKLDEIDEAVKKAFEEEKAKKNEDEKGVE